MSPGTHPGLALRVTKLEAAFPAFVTSLFLHSECPTLMQHAVSCDLRDKRRSYVWYRRYCRLSRLRRGISGLRTGSRSISTRTFPRLERVEPFQGVLGAYNNRFWNAQPQIPNSEYLFFVVRVPAVVCLGCGLVLRFSAGIGIFLVRTSEAEDRGVGVTSGILALACLSPTWR